MQHISELCAGTGRYDVFFRAMWECLYRMARSWQASELMASATLAACEVLGVWEGSKVRFTTGTGVMTFEMGYGYVANP